MPKFYSALFIMSLIAPSVFAQSGPDYDQLYKKRFATLLANGGFLKEYSPTEVISGVANYQPLKSADKTILPQKIAQQITDYAKERNSSAVFIWKEGELQYKKFFGDTTDETLIVSKSLSKPLGAIAIGRAIKLGKIKSLNQAVADFIPQWKGTEKEDVRVKHLLNMHAGFLKQGYTLEPNHPLNTAYLSYEHEKVLINDYPLVDKPGRVFSYNNATADMVALVIESATGQRFAEFIGKEVFAKVGAQGGNLWVNREGGVAHSGCCKYLPAETYFRLALLLLNNGKFNNEQLLPTNYVEEMTKPSPDNPHMGLGVWLGQPYKERRGYTGKIKLGPQVLHSEPYIDESLYLFDGNANQVVYILPKHNMVIMRLGSAPPKDLEWDNSYLPNLVVNGLNTSVR